VGIKRPGREADHSPPSSAEVTKAWSHTSTLPIRLHGVVLSYSTGTDSPLPVLPVGGSYQFQSFDFRHAFLHLCHISKHIPFSK